jgi:hypothetical protein
LGLKDGLHKLLDGLDGLLDHILGVKSDLSGNSFGIWSFIVVNNIKNHD